MANTIQIKRKTTTGTPSAGSIAVSELFLVQPDRKVYTKNDDGTFIDITGNCAYWSKLSAITSAIANTETQILSLTIPANTLKVGDTIRINTVGLHTNGTQASTSIFRCRIGTASLSGVIPASSSFVNGTTAKTNVISKCEGLILVQTVGATGTCLGQLYVDKGFASATTPVGVTASVTINTTVQNIVELTFISGHAQASNTIVSATIEILR